MESEKREGWRGLAADKGSGRPLTRPLRSNDTANPA
jgi:hypothetical protein